jgi:hypothetical protein
LEIQFGECLLQHLQVAWVRGNFELLTQAQAVKEQALVFAVSLLLLSRKRRTTWRTLVGPVGLLLFDGLAFPASSHEEIVAQCGPKTQKLLASSLLRHMVVGRVERNTQI